MRRNTSSSSRLVDQARVATRAIPRDARLQIGPYTLTLVMLPKARMPDQRSLAVPCIEQGIFALRDDLSGRRLAYAFLRTLIRLIHYSRGCQQGCVEEAYTHSLATGLVEFAQRNPAAWLWFNQLLDALTPGPSNYANVVRGQSARVPPPPRRFVIAGQPITLTAIGEREAGSAFGWYLYEEHQARLHAGLSGANLAVVAVHELTHAVHWQAGLDDGSPHRAFITAQTRYWLDFMFENPGAWRWLAYLLSHEAKQGGWAAADARRLASGMRSGMCAPDSIVARNTNLAHAPRMRPVRHHQRHPQQHPPHRCTTKPRARAQSG